MTKDPLHKRRHFANHTLPDILPFSDPLPQKIGPYKIESLLNKGGMSLLYLGIHSETHEPIAIKVLSSKYLSHPEMVERFLKEATIIEIINHPNIVKLFGHGKWEEGVYIAMEFVQGISLRQMILQEAMSLKRALNVVLQIAYALAHLHAHGIIHRDLKPENILLTAQGGIKVIDFGISQLYTETIYPAKKQIVGTPVYMSPEQQQNPLNITFSADIYSLAIITYELVVGRLSYGKVHLSLIPQGLQKILARALQPAPQDRYEDIVDFIQIISDYLASNEIDQEMRGSDYLGELNENLKDAQQILTPTHLPKWPRLEIALASNANTAVSSIYYDFFQQKDGVFNIVMGECLKTGVAGLLHIAILKGMVQALGNGFERSTAFVAALNERVRAAASGEIFTFSLLTLYPAFETFSYISCGDIPIWSIASGTETPQRLSVENPPLGSASGIKIIEVDSNYLVGDTLILHTFQAESLKKSVEIHKDEQLVKETLIENLFLSPQKQVDALFRKVTYEHEMTHHQRPVIVIGIQRTS